MAYAARRAGILHRAMTNCSSCGADNEILERAADSALTGTRGALAELRTLGLAWDEAMTALETATVLHPAEPQVAEAPWAARETFVRLGARPLIARLDAILSNVEPVGELSSHVAGRTTAAVQA